MRDEQTTLLFVTLYNNLINTSLKDSKDNKTNSKTMSELSGLSEQEEKDLRKKLSNGLGNALIERFADLQAAITTGKNVHTS